MNRLKSILAFFRLLNEEGQLSVTNIVVIALLVKVLASSQCDLGSIAALIGAVGAYHFDKFTSLRKQAKGALPQSPQSLLELDELRGEVNKLKLTMGIMPNVRPK